jgi:transposase-like protein
MTPHCPHCISVSPRPDSRPRVRRSGSFYRRSDSRTVQRFVCLKCKKGFSFATLSPCYLQNKRHFNERVRRQLCSGMSQRRTAKVLGLNRKTVVRKFLFLCTQTQKSLALFHKHRPLAQIVEFDDLETFEHTKCKPLSVTLAVEYKTRRILGFSVSQMPCKGKLARISVKKYGFRRDDRAQGRQDLFEQIKPLIKPGALIKSDKNPHYPKDVKRHFPDSVHETHKGRRGCIVGQGELKKIGRDPLFSLNHTCARLRDDIKRLVRRTWATTKKPERLHAHLMIYSLYHNQSLEI